MTLTTRPARAASTVSTPQPVLRWIGLCAAANAAGNAEAPRAPPRGRRLGSGSRPGAGGRGGADALAAAGGAGPGPRAGHARPRARRGGRRAGPSDLVTVTVPDAGLGGPRGRFPGPGPVAPRTAPMAARPGPGCSPERRPSGCRWAACSGRPGTGAARPGQAPVALGDRVGARVGTGDGGDLHRRIHPRCRLGRAPRTRPGCDHRRPGWRPARRGHRLVRAVVVRAGRARSDRRCGARFAAADHAARQPGRAEGRRHRERQTVRVPRGRSPGAGWARRSAGPGRHQAVVAQPGRPSARGGALRWGRGRPRPAQCSPSTTRGTARRWAGTSCSSLVLRCQRARHSSCSPGSHLLAAATSPCATRLGPALRRPPGAQRKGTVCRQHLGRATAC